MFMYMSKRINFNPKILSCYRIHELEQQKGRPANDNTESLDRTKALERRTNELLERSALFFQSFYHMPLRNSFYNNL